MSSPVSLLFPEQKRQSEGGKQEKHCPRPGTLAATPVGLEAKVYSILLFPSERLYSYHNCCSCLAISRGILPSIQWRYIYRLKTNRGDRMHCRKDKKK